MKKRKDLLGIVICDQAIGVADIEQIDGSFKMRRCAEYALPKAVTTESIALETSGFKSFLKEHKFRVKQAVIGISGKHMISTLVKLPPIQDSQIRHDTIRINLEQKMEVDFSEIVFDYDDTQQIGEDRILVLMLLKKELDQVKSFLKESGITPLVLTNTSLGLASPTHAGTICRLVEYSSSFELCLFKEGHLFAVSRLAKDPNQKLDSKLAEKVRRQVNRICLSAAIADTVKYYICGICPESSLQRQQIQDILGEYEYKALTPSNTPLCEMAGILAKQAAAGSAGRINFLNGRHDKTRSTVFSQWFRKTAVIVAGIIILIGIFLLGWHSDKRQIADLRSQLDAMETDVNAAQKMIDQYNDVRGWFQQEPRFLGILRELTLSFPESNDIWLTSLAVDSSLNQILTGRTLSEDAVLDVAESLRSKEVFDDIKILYIRKMGQGTDIMTFAIGLQYRKGL